MKITKLSDVTLIQETFNIQTSTNLGMSELCFCTKNRTAKFSSVLKIHNVKLWLAYH